MPFWESFMLHMACRGTFVGVIPS